VTPPTAEPAAAAVPPRRWLASLLLVLGVAGVILLLFARRGPPPLLPGDLVHRASMGSPVPATCFNCHATSGPVPRKPTHTGRQDCDSCHQLP
jgi:hypothetical protein